MNSRYVVCLCITLIVTVIVATIGGYLLLDYLIGGQSSPEPVSAGIKFAWGQSGGNISPNINIELSSDINHSGVSRITISVLAWFSSNNPFGFALMSPYIITNQYCQSALWTARNFGNSSLIYLTYNPNVNKTHTNDELNTTCGFQFTGLQYRYDRGTYSIDLPFAEAGPAWVWNYVIQKSPQLTTDTSLVLHLNVYVPADCTTITTTPTHTNCQTSLSGSLQGLSVVHIDMNQANDLILSYQDLAAAGRYSNEAVLGPLIIPIALGTSYAVSRKIYENRRTWKDSQFCIACSTPLMKGSKFCNKCGGKQPE